MQNEHHHHHHHCVRSNVCISMNTRSFLPLAQHISSKKKRDTQKPTPSVFFCCGTVLVVVAVSAYHRAPIESAACWLAIITESPHQSDLSPRLSWLFAAWSSSSQRDAASAFVSRMHAKHTQHTQHTTAHHLCPLPGAAYTFRLRLGTAPRDRDDGFPWCFSHTQQMLPRLGACVNFAVIIVVRRVCVVRALCCKCALRCKMHHHFIRAESMYKIYCAI